MLFQVLFDCFEFGFEFFKCHFEYTTLISTFPNMYFLQFSLNYITYPQVFLFLLLINIMNRYDRGFLIGVVTIYLRLYTGSLQPL